MDEQKAQSETNTDNKNGENQTSDKPMNGTTGEPTISEVDQEGKTIHPQEEESQKKKLVVRFSLSSKSLDDSPPSDNQANNQNEQNQANQSTSAVIASHLKSSRAFQNFINSALYKNPHNPEVKNSLRAADTQRLLNTHQSRENSPEPGKLSLVLINVKQFIYIQTFVNRIAKQRKHSQWCHWFE